MRENGGEHADKRQTALLESAICAVVQRSIKVPLAHANDSNILFCPLFYFGTLEKTH